MEQHQSEDSSEQTPAAKETSGPPPDATGSAEPSPQSAPERRNNATRQGAEPQSRGGQERSQRQNNHRSGQDKNPQSRSDNRGDRQHPNRRSPENPAGNRQPSADGATGRNLSTDPSSESTPQPEPDRQTDDAIRTERNLPDRRASDPASPDRVTPDRVTPDRVTPDRVTPDRLIIGITLGDYNGVGPEVILKALQQNRLQRICTPVIYGSMRVLNRYRNLLQQAGFSSKDWNINGIQHVGQANHKLINVINCWNDGGRGGEGSNPPQEVQPGKITPEAGQAALACLQRATEDLKAGHLHALVTAPINKHNIQTEEFQFPGHTEYLADAFGVAENLMFLISETLRVGVVTGHVPVGGIPAGITRERVLTKLHLMYESLRNDFGIRKPRIAVLGLNPHAGEDGLLGTEETDILKPLISDLRNKGQLIYGPFSADGFFAARSYRRYDAVLAMYHDQGLIPFKMLAFDDGVNFTAGMPVVRTSPDHGTAYDIAGKNGADESSMLQAIYAACDIARYRLEMAEIERTALKKNQIVNS